MRASRGLRPGTTCARSALAVLEELVAPALGTFDGDGRNVRAVHRHLNEATRIQGRSGLVVNVISAVDIALWDVSAKRRGLPLAAHLGGETGRVPER